jgi:signal transduction histidine kinase
MDSLSAALRGPRWRYLRSAWPWRGTAWCVQAGAAAGCLYGLGCAVVVPPASGTWDLATPGGMALQALMVALLTAGAVVVAAWQRAAVRVVGYRPVASRYPGPASVGIGDGAEVDGPTAAGGRVAPARRALRRSARVARLAGAVGGDVLLCLALAPVLALGGALALLGWSVPVAVVALVVAEVLPEGSTGLGGWWLPVLVGTVALSVALPWVAGWLPLLGVRVCRWLSDPAGDLARRQLAERQAASVRLSDAFSAERRRIERDLHDGAQQRIVAQGMTLARARAALGDRPGPALALVEQAARENREILADLRALVRAVSPPVLFERGLGAALEEVAARSPVPVAVDAELTGRPPDLAEQTAYFVVLEALTNAAKHADAATAVVRVRQDASHLRVLVRDDGCGGATLPDDGGLAGLVDRVSAIGGTMHVSSPPGGPTVVAADVPLELPRRAHAEVARWGA